MRQIERAISISDRLMAWNMLESASGVLERVLERHPYHPELLRRMGRIRLAQGLPQEAIPYLKLAITHDDIMAPMRGRPERASALNSTADASSPQA